MTHKLQRPAMKLANTKVSESDMIYFSLGLDNTDFVLPSERNDYRSDSRAVQLLKAIHEGKDVSGQDYSGINLKNADLSGADLSGSVFKGACFYKTIASQCNFSDCDFSEAYFEDCDFSQSNFLGADFRKTFLKNLKLEHASLDEDLRKRISAMDLLIHKIESGEIDIHCLTQTELMCLDLRRLDMTKVDVSDIDLSMFVMEGVNLSGVYINPLQRMSMENFQQSLLSVEKLSEKKLKEEVLKTFKTKKEELEKYAKMIEEENKKQDFSINISSKNLQRPAFKQDEFSLSNKEEENNKNNLNTDNEEKNGRDNKNQTSSDETPDLVYKNTSLGKDAEIKIYKIVDQSFVIKPEKKHKNRT